MNFPLPDGLTMGSLRFLNRDESFNPAPQYFAKNRAYHADIEKMSGLDNCRSMHRINVVTETGEVVQFNASQKFYDAMQNFIMDITRENSRLMHVRQFKKTRCLIMTLKRFPNPTRKYLRPC